MPKRGGGKKSGRIATRDKAKVMRKRRENKRDLKKAATAMRKSGLRIRPKKNRERAKLALSLSSKDLNKEKALNALLRSRERVRANRQQRRQEYAAQKKAAADNGEQDDNDNDDDDGDQQLQVNRLRPGDEGYDSDADKQDANWMHPVSGNMLERIQRKERKEAHIAAAKAERQRGIRRFLAFAPGQDGSGNPAFQLRKIISSMRAEVPAFLITLDARCVLESVPWSVLDDIIADAVALHSTQQQDADDAGGASSPSAASSKSTTKTLRHVFFVLTRADLVAADVLVKGAVSLGHALKERYHDNEESVKSIISFNCVACSSTKSTDSVIYLLKALQNRCVEIAAQRRRDLASSFSSATTNNDDSEENNNNTAVSPISKKDASKVVFCVYGYPNTGRTALLSALIKRASMSACAILLPSQIVELVDATGHRRFRFEDAKQLSLLNLSDARAVQEAPIVGGDILFHRHNTADKIASPETIATALLSDLTPANFESVCRAFGQPMSSNPKHFLFNLGKCVRREGGFYTPHGDDAIVTSVADGLFASRVDGATQPTLRVFHQAPVQKRDGGNAARIGARILLQEFCRGDVGLRWTTNELPSNISSSDQIATSLGTVFAAPPAANRRGRNNNEADDDGPLSVAEIGVATVMGLQYVAGTMPVGMMQTTTGLTLAGSSVSPQAELPMVDEEQATHGGALVGSDAAADDDLDFDEEMPEDFMMPDGDEFASSGDDDEEFVRGAPARQQLLKQQQQGAADHDGDDEDEEFDEEFDEEDPMDFYDDDDEEDFDDDDDEDYLDEEEEEEDFSDEDDE